MTRNTTEPDVLDPHGVQDNGYQGPVELIGTGPIATVEATITGHFDPFSGKFSWYGRLAADPAVTELARCLGGRPISLRTLLGEATTSLSDRDPWGRFRVGGLGRPPFPRPTDLG